MGVFDNVNFVTTCPNCKKQLAGFQSKSGDPSGKKLEFWQVDEFHASCRNCRTWVGYTFKTNAVQRRSIEDYELEFYPLPRRKFRIENRGTFPRLGDVNMISTGEAGG